MKVSDIIRIILLVAISLPFTVAAQSFSSPGSNEIKETLPERFGIGQYEAAMVGCYMVADNNDFIAVVKHKVQRKGKKSLVAKLTKQAMKRIDRFCLPHNHSCEQASPICFSGSATVGAPDPKCPPAYPITEQVKTEFGTVMVESHRFKVYKNKKRPGRTHRVVAGMVVVNALLRPHGMSQDEFDGALINLRVNTFQQVRNAIFQSLVQQLGFLAGALVYNTAMALLQGAPSIPVSGHYPMDAIECSRIITKTPTPTPTATPSPDNSCELAGGTLECPAPLGLNALAIADGCVCRIPVPTATPTPDTIPTLMPTATPITDAEPTPTPVVTQ